MILVNLTAKSTWRISSRCFPGGKLRRGSTSQQVFQKTAKGSSFAACFPTTMTTYSNRQEYIYISESVAKQQLREASSRCLSKSVELADFSPIRTTYCRNGRTTYSASGPRRIGSTTAIPPWMTWYVSGKRSLLTKGPATVTTALFERLPRGGHVRVANVAVGESFPPRLYQSIWQSDHHQKLFSTTRCVHAPFLVFSISIK